MMRLFCWTFFLGHTYWMRFQYPDGVYERCINCRKLRKVTHEAHTPD